jgi:hypothetical protein
MQITRPKFFQLVIFCVVFSLAALGFFSFASSPSFAACNYPAYCAEPPGSCGNTCTQGPCMIGNTVCIGTAEASDCYCTDGDPAYEGACNPDNSGLNCGSGHCECNYTRNCSCNDVPGTCCGPGGGCGWTSWSACSVACGGGTQTRTNTCNGATQSQACNTQDCCGVWGAWGACSGGTQSRTDNCGNNQSQSCGGGCTDWSSCSASCGPGTKTRVCNGNVESTSCNNGDCCGIFGAWGACSVTCGGGTQSRTDGCGNVQNQSCNTQACECTVGAWSACSESCGLGTRSRSNSCATSTGGVETEVCDTCTNECACPTACGQETTCGTCNDSDFGNPGPVELTPASGNLTIPANRQVTVSWTSALKADNYDVQIYPTGTTAGQECTAANTFCETATTDLDYTFTAPANVANYSWRVRLPLMII